MSGLKLVMLQFSYQADTELSKVMVYILSRFHLVLLKIMLFNLFFSFRSLDCKNRLYPQAASMIL